MSLHVRLSMPGYLLTAQGRLRAGDYANMRRMPVRLPLAGPTVEPAESQVCAEYYLYPQHGRLVA